MTELKGVGADAPTVTNERGGKQAEAQYAFHLIDREALLSLAEVLAQGAKKYTRDNWRLIPAEEHFNHMLIHAIAALEGDITDNHIDHMFCRAMMFYATYQAENRKGPDVCMAEESIGRTE
jgi:hypothetical protein